MAGGRMFVSRIFSSTSAHHLNLVKNIKWQHLKINRHLHVAMMLCGSTLVRMPSLSPTMQHGTIVKWHKKEGDTFGPGDLLCEIQTDKAVLGFEAEEEGILAKIVKPSNSSNVVIGSLIAVTVEPGDDWKNVVVPQESDSTPPSSTAAPSSAVSSPPPPPTAAPSTTHHELSSYGPAVRSLLEVYNIDPHQVNATGPHNRLLKGDLLKFIAEKNLKPSAPTLTSPPSAKVGTSTSVVTAEKTVSTRITVSGQGLPDFIDLPLSTMRSVIAKRLTESKMTIPHAYSTIDCNISKLLQLRTDLMKEGIKVSVNDFVIKAAAIALQRVPEVNAIWKNDSVQRLLNIDISIAVATDNGLITPIIKDAIGLGVQEISNVLKDLAARARERKLKPEEFMGGSFTISNLGMFGITSFSAVINPPQACILAVSGTRAILDEDRATQHLMSVTTSCDARVIDDVTAAAFLQSFRDIMESPSLMLGHSRTSVVQKLFAK